MLTRGRDAQARGSPSTVFSPLPRCFVRAVFLLLPADQRLRCAEVSRACRALLADTSLWIFLDLSTTSGLTRFSCALFRAAVAKAGGQLSTLDVSGRFQEKNGRRLEQTIRLDVLRAAVSSNAASLTELRVNSPNTGNLDTTELQCLLKAAPQLQYFELGVLCYNVLEAIAMLRNEAPFGALRMRFIHIYDKTGVGHASWNRGYAGGHHYVRMCSDMRRSKCLHLFSRLCTPLTQWVLSWMRVSRCSCARYASSTAALHLLWWRRSPGSSLQVHCENYHCLNLSLDSMVRSYRMKKRCASVRPFEHRR